jgi:predicted nucleic acid-binding protein
LHQQAIQFLRDNRLPLLAVAPLVAETCYFLDIADKRELLEWVYRGGVEVADLPVSAYPHLAGSLRKYADRDLDFTDAALIWLADTWQERRILTVDRTDFSIFRLSHGGTFHLVDWYGSGPLNKDMDGARIVLIRAIRLVPRPLLKSRICSTFSTCSPSRTIRVPNQARQIG